MLAHRAQEDLLGSLFPSKATLLVVPNTLLDHWDVSIAGGGSFSLSAVFFPLSLPSVRILPNVSTDACGVAGRAGALFQTNRLHLF